MVRLLPAFILSADRFSPSEGPFVTTTVPLEKVSFGNIFAESFDRIWNSSSYVAFRECLRVRRRRFQERYSLAASIALDTERLRKSGGMVLPEPPEPCKTCHRMLGL